MAIEKLTEFAKTGQKDTDQLDLEVGFIVNRKPARQWFNWLFNTLTTKINEIIDADFMPKSDVIDNLTTDDATKPVSAKQAKVLQDNKLGKTENASSASKLQTVRTVSFSGAATGSFNYDGSSNSSAVLTLANSGVVAGTYGTTFKIPVITVNAKGLISTITTQDIPTASTEQKGIVQLNDTLTSTSTIQALTAAQGKKLQDEKVAKTDVVNNLTSTDTQNPLSAAQGKVLNDQAFGIDQQPINMTSTRFKNTTYTNATKKAKVINIGGTDSRGGYAEFFVNSIPASRLTKSSNVSTSMCAVVPPGSTYELGDFNFSFWTET